MSETAIQTAIRAALKPLPYVEMFRNKQSGRGRMKTGLGTGTSDLVGIVSRRADGARIVPGA